MSSSTRLEFRVRDLSMRGFSLVEWGDPAYLRNVRSIQVETGIAHLWAAAPQMLEELRAIVDGWTAGELGAPGVPPLTPWEEERLRHARALLIKATGKEQTNG